MIPSRIAPPKSDLELSNDIIKTHSTCLSSASEATFTGDTHGLGRVAGVPES